METTVLEEGFDILTGTLQPLAGNPEVFLESTPQLRFNVANLSVVECDELDCGDTVEGGSENTAIWSPDGRRVAFLGIDDQAVRSEGGRALYVAYLEGAQSGQIRKLVELSPGQGLIDWPTWSPGGEFIAYAHSADGEIYVVDADSDPPTPRRVTQGASVDNKLHWVRPPLVLP